MLDFLNLFSILFFGVKGLPIPEFNNQYDATML